MEWGIQEFIAVRVAVHSHKLKKTLNFGLSKGGFYGGEIPQTGEGADLISVGWSRSMSKSPSGVQPGRLAFALHGRVRASTGQAWAEIINPGDWVELQVCCLRTPDEEEYSKTWWTEFVGRVQTPKLTEDAKGGTQTVVIAEDAMGDLNYEHFAYWRNLGQSIGGAPNVVDITERAGAIEVKDLSTGATRPGQESDFMENSIAGGADLVFRALLYNRLGVRAKIEGKEYRWEDFHAYRFESDDFGISVDLQSLAPEGSSWSDAVGWAVDSPEFYEFFLDNVGLDELKGGALGTRSGGNAGQASIKQTRYKDAVFVGLGGRIERFVIRPAPFPVYDPERGGYDDAAWNSLHTVVAWPWGGIKADTSRTRDHIYSVFSADLVNTPAHQVDNAASSEAQAQLVVDQERYRWVTGYRPLDLRTKRIASAGVNTGAYTTSPVELARALAWQAYSFHAFNDRAYQGVITSAFDWRPRLGSRYIAEGFMYYVEGYQHEIDAHSATSSFTVTRGMTLPQYGIKMRGPVNHMQGRAAQETEWLKEWRLIPDSLGRKRPGEMHAPILVNALSADFDPGVVEDITGEAE